MKKILVLAGSNSSKSINRRLATYASKLIKDVELLPLDLNDYEMPIYSYDREEAGGIPELALKFSRQIEEVDGIIISFAEHNGSYSTAFKNILDWLSRHKQKAWTDKTMLLMSTSPGGRGGSSVLATATTSFPFFGAKVASSFSLPSFMEHFSEEDGIKNPELKGKFDEAIDTFSKALHST